MTKGGQLKAVTVTILVALLWMTSEAGAAPCGSTAAGFEAWKKQFADEARGKGVSAGSRALQYPSSSCRRGLAPESLGAAERLSRPRSFFTKISSSR